MTNNGDVRQIRVRFLTSKSLKVSILPQKSSMDMIFSESNFQKFFLKSTSSAKRRGSSEKLLSTIYFARNKLSFYLLGELKLAVFFLNFVTCCYKKLLS